MPLSFHSSVRRYGNEPCVNCGLGVRSANRVFFLTFAIPNRTAWDLLLKATAYSASDRWVGYDQGGWRHLLVEDPICGVQLLSLC